MPESLDGLPPAVLVQICKYLLDAGQSHKNATLLALRQVCRSLNVNASKSLCRKLQLRFDPANIERTLKILRSVHRQQNHPMLIHTRRIEVWLPGAGLAPLTASRQDGPALLLQHLLAKSRSLSHISINVDGAAEHMATSGLLKHILGTECKIQSFSLMRSRQRDALEGIRFTQLRALHLQMEVQLPDMSLNLFSQLSRLHLDLTHYHVIPHLDDDFDFPPIL